jgi:hypothetical protein
VDWKRVKRGARFVHKRYFYYAEGGIPVQETCHITKVTRHRDGTVDMLFYRVGGTAGFLTKCNAKYFETESFMEWVEAKP